MTDGRGGVRAGVVRHLAEVAATLPELGLRPADVDALACDLHSCDDIDTAALHEDSVQLRTQLAHLGGVPSALADAAWTLPGVLSGESGSAAVRRLTCAAALARADLARAAEIGDALSAAARGIETVRAQLDHRIAAVDATGIGGQMIPAVRAALDSDDITQMEVDSWSEEVCAIIEHVRAAVADTRGYAQAILGRVASAFAHVDPEPYAARVAGMQRSESTTPATAIASSERTEMLEVVLRVATAAGSLAQNVIVSAGAAVEAAATVAAVPPTDRRPDLEPDQAAPIGQHRPVDDEPTEAAPNGAATNEPEATATVPVAITDDRPPDFSSAPDISPAPEPLPPTPAPPAAESGLALLGDS